MTAPCPDSARMLTLTAAVQGGEPEEANGLARVSSHGSLRAASPGPTLGRVSSYGSLRAASPGPTLSRQVQPTPGTPALRVAASGPGFGSFHVKP